MVKPTYDKLPITVEAPGYRKPTGEFTFVIVTPKQYSDLAKAFMERISSTGVLFFRPCLPEEIDGVLAAGNGTLPAGSSTPAQHEVQVIDVETLAARLDMTERNVQIMAGDNPPLLVRMERGQYDMLASYVALWKAYKELQRGQGDALNHEKIEAMKLKRQSREMDLLERSGQLVNRDMVKKAFEKVLMLVRQRFVMMPKYMAPRLDGLPAKEQEPLLEDYARESLASLSAPDLGGEAPTDEPRSHTEKIEKPVSRKARKGRKGRNKK